MTASTHPEFVVGYAGGMRVDRPRASADRDAVLDQLSPMTGLPPGTFVFAFRDRESLGLRGAMLVHHDGNTTAFHVCGARGPSLRENLLEAMHRVLALTHPHLRLTPEVTRDLGMGAGVEASWSHLAEWPIEHLDISPEEVEVLRILDEPMPYLLAPEQFEEWLRSRP